MCVCVSILDQNMMPFYEMSLQVVSVIEESATDVALVFGQLAALVSDVPAQRVGMFVRFPARRAQPTSAWKKHAGKIVMKN